jgi:hypothetical protein
VSDLWFEEDLAWHRHAVRSREMYNYKARREAGHERRVMVLTGYIGPTYDPNMDWQACLTKHKSGSPIGFGPTEADAVRALYIEIAKAEEEARR